MDTQIVVAIVGVLAALLGSAIGGLTTYYSARSMRRVEWVLSMRDREIVTREKLYADFLGEASRLVVRSFDSESKDASELTSLVSLETRLWFCSDVIGKSARRIAGCVMTYHGKREKEGAPDFPELRDEFIQLCKDDLARLKATV